MLVGVFNRISATEGCVVWNCQFCVSGVFDALPKQIHYNMICEGHKAVLEAIKRSLPVLKSTSESVSFKKKFADTIYYIIQSKSNHSTPSLRMCGAG